MIHTPVLNRTSDLWIFPNKIKLNIQPNTTLDNKENFISGTKLAYQVVRKHYYKREDFLEKEYTSPALSLALNYLRNLEKSESFVEKKISNVSIVASRIEEIPFYSNNRMLGLWTYSEAESEVIAGVLGPEAQHLWLKVPQKLVVDVKFEFSDKTTELWIFETKLEEKYKWQVSNINNIIS